MIAKALEVLTDHKWNAEDQFGIRMALEEAIMNAIKHGSQSDPSKLVEIAMGLSDIEFSAEITDSGYGFDPEKVPDPTTEENLEKDCGRGVMLMKTFVDVIEFNECGNRVTLKKMKTKPKTESETESKTGPKNEPEN